MVIRNKDRYQPILMLEAQVDGRIKDALNRRIEITLRTAEPMEAARSCIKIRALPMVMSVGRPFFHNWVASA